MKQLRKNLLKQKGQSTIEFIFCFSFAVFILVYTIKIALNYTTGYLVHYATFMASRAYAVFDNGGSEAQAISRAKEVFEATRVHLFNNAVDSGNLQFTSVATDPSQYITLGAYIDWETPFSVGGRFGGVDTLKMRSESFLGREPTRQVCALRTCQAASGSSGGAACSEGKAFTLGDNGC